MTFFTFCMSRPLLFLDIMVVGSYVLGEERVFIYMSNLDMINSVEMTKQLETESCIGRASELGETSLKWERWSYFKKSLRMFDYGWISILVISLALTLFLQSEKLSLSFTQTRALQQAKDLSEGTQSAVKNPEELIRFHVLANSDSEEDQALKLAVRDAILKEVSPRLAASRSLEESREILTGLRPEMEAIGRAVIESRGKNLAVKTEYGNFIFPTKSYGSIILPAGEYEAVRVIIGEGKGSNWWCVLFPPLCFVDIENSTAVAVDGKPGIPYDEKNNISEKQTQVSKEPVQGLVQEDVSGPKKSVEKPKVRFWIIEELSKFF